MTHNSKSNRIILVTAFTQAKNSSKRDNSHSIGEFCLESNPKVHTTVKPEPTAPNLTCCTHSYIADLPLQSGSHEPQKNPVWYIRPPCPNHKYKAKSTVYPSFPQTQNFLKTTELSPIHILPFMVPSIRPSCENFKSQPLPYPMVTYRPQNYIIPR